MRWLESLPCVEKVILGISNRCRHKFSPGCLKRLRDKETGITFNLYSSYGVTKIFVKCDKTALLKEVFP